MITPILQTIAWERKSQQCGFSSQGTRLHTLDYVSPGYYWYRLMVQHRENESVNCVPQQPHRLLLRIFLSPLHIFPLNPALAAKGSPLGHNKKKLANVVMKNWVTCSKKTPPNFALLSEQFLLIFLSMSSIQAFPAAIQALNAGLQAALHLDTMCVANNLKWQDSRRAFV